jgi:Cys-rich protein (TIGR01571 family)
MQNFHEPLFSCDKTPGLFCFLLSFTCLGGPCCVQGKVVSDSTNKNFGFHCLLPCMCLCIGASYNRSKLRENLGLESSYSKDILTHLFCSPCAVNQEFLEFHSHSFNGNPTLLSLLKSKASKRSFTPQAPIDPSVN